MNNLKFWLPVYLYAVFIFVLSAIPELPQIGPDVPNSDKFFHMLEYGLFGLLLARAFKNSSSEFIFRNFQVMRLLHFVRNDRNLVSLRGRSPWQSIFSKNKILILSVIISCLYGITDEFHQSFVPGRESNAWDVLFDTLGAFFGCVIWTKKRRP